jgi:mannitol/fructose-specific phosphotransferase system IIA component (Ntr-type)
MGISQQGIDYDSLDAKPVHLVFLLLGPEHESEEHLLALKRLAQLLDNPLFYGEMISQTTPEGAWAVLKKYEDVII